MPVGPLDRRTFRKRCAACTKRRIKCEREWPCIYCTKTKQKCVPPPAATKTAVVFVNVARKAPANLIRIPTLGSSLQSDPPTLFLKHFFSEFLPANDFGGNLDVHMIIPQFQKVPSLYQATVAVGALDMSNNVRMTSAERQNARVGALNAYRVSIVSFQSDIGKSGLMQNDSTLWTTFILGLFELMYDKTGEGFVKHFLHGTSKILQLRGPEAHLYGNGRSFFLTVRVFEICRALIYSIYSESTFLCLPRWRQVAKQISQESEVWHPKEELFDLMISCSALGNHVGLTITTSAAMVLDTDCLLEPLAAEGLQLRSELEDWHSTFEQWTRNVGNTSNDKQSILAVLYYHGISIFLSGIFDYRSEFDHIMAPRLSQSDIKHHVQSILTACQKALRITNIGAVLYLFPLRVAGARVTSREQAEAILTMLEEISKRRFVVAGSLIRDLKALWVQKEF